MGAIKEAFLGQEPLMSVTPEIHRPMAAGATHEGVINLLDRARVHARLQRAATDEERIVLAEQLVSFGYTEEQAMEKVIRSMEQQEAVS